MTPITNDELATVQVVCQAIGGYFATAEVLITSLDIENDSIEIGRYNIRRYNGMRLTHTINGDVATPQVRYVVSMAIILYNNDDGCGADVVNLADTDHLIAAVRECWHAEEDRRLDNVIASAIQVLEAERDAETAYQAGYSTYEKGDAESENPHKDAADLSEAWLEGWADAEREAKDKAEAEAAEAERRRRASEDFRFMVKCASKGNMAMYNLFRDRSI